MSVELYLSLEQTYVRRPEKKVLRRIFGTEQQDRENYIKKSFITCILQKKLLK
jgi:hypothetical protein